MKPSECRWCRDIFFVDEDMQNTVRNTLNMHGEIRATVQLNRLMKDDHKGHKGLNEKVGVLMDTLGIDKGDNWMNDDEDGVGNG